MALYPSAQELSYVRSLESERIALTGQMVVYYTLIRGANVDPLYNEPDDSGWEYSRFRLRAAITYEEMDNTEISTRDEGLTVERDAEAFIAYNEWHSNGPPVDFGADRLPKAGDVVHVMAQYFDVVRGSEGGSLIDQTKSVGFKLMLKKKAKFSAVRKLG